MTSKGEALLALLRSKPQRPISELAGQLYGSEQDGDRSRVRALLARLERKHQVRNVGTGRWEATTTESPYADHQAVVARLRSLLSYVEMIRDAKDISEVILAVNRLKESAERSFPPLPPEPETVLNAATCLIRDFEREASGGREQAEKSEAVEASLVALQGALARWLACPRPTVKEPSGRRAKLLAQAKELTDKACAAFEEDDSHSYRSFLKDARSCLEIRARLPVRRKS